MSAGPWIAIFLAAAMAWAPSLRWLALTLLVYGYAVAVEIGRLSFQSALPIALMAFAAYAISPSRNVKLRHAGHMLFIALAVALSMHWLPGFHNPRVIGPERLTADAIPFTMYLNLDKPLIGFWLLLAVPWIQPPHDLRTSLKAAAVGLLMTAAICLTIALATGLITWAPKWPSVSWLWMLNNLLLVTLTEEALFRGYVQGGLSRLLKRLPHANTIAVCVAAMLFGFAHLAGGWQWMVLGGIAGVGYGLAYRLGGLRAAVLAHFGFNVVHFFLFSYPMLQ